MRTSCTLKICGRESNEVCLAHTGTFKDLFESYLQEWLWHKHCGDDPFGNIIKHIEDLKMKYAKMRKLFFLQLYALFVIPSPLYGGKKQITASSHETKFKEENQGGKREVTRDVMSPNMIAPSTGKNDYTGQLHYCRDFSNTYYHLLRSHIQGRNPAFNGFLYISTDLYLTGLDEGHRAH